MTDKREQLKKLLEEITEGKGPYSRDPLEHAENCIENMKKLAREALQVLEEGV